MNSQTNTLYQQTLPLTKPVRSGKVITLYPVQTKTLLDDKRTYLIFHVAIGAALGASILMVAIALFTEIWLVRSMTSMTMTLSVYGIITYYYHGIKSKKSSLMYSGITIVTVSAASVLLLILLL